MQAGLTLEYCEFMRKLETCSSDNLTSNLFKWRLSSPYLPNPNQTNKSVLNSPHTTDHVFQRVEQSY